MGIIRNYEENGIPQNNRLKYSDSTLGQGPIIQKSIPDDLGDPVFSKNELNSRTDDLLRITTLLTRNQGQKFILNNAALNQLENAQKIGKALTGDNENSKGVIGRTIGTLGQVGRGIIKQAADTTNLIASTLAQVPVNGTGTHFVHKFRTDTYLEPGGDLFGSFLGIKEGYQSAPKTLFGGKLPTVLEGEKVESRLKGESKDITDEEFYPKVPKYENEFDFTAPIEKDTYLKKFGVNHRMSDRGFADFNFASGSNIQGDGTVITPFENYIDSVFTENTEGSTPSETKRTEKSVKTGLSYLTGISKPTKSRALIEPNDPVRMSSRVRIGDPGRRSYSITTPYDRPRVDESVDKINELSPSLLKVKAEDGRDLVKFRFKIVTPETERWLYFRAYLDSFDDSYTGNWNSFNYVGRGEQFHTYNSFDRSISLSFKIAAQTRYEMKPIYQKMVSLASATAPTYSSEGFMRGTFAELTVGSYLYETPGIIESVQYSWQTDYPWEIAMNEPEQRTEGGGDTYQQELPMIMNATVQFKPIHRFLPETGLKHYITQNQKGSNIQFFNDQTFTTRTDLRTLTSTARSVDLANSALGPQEKDREFTTVQPIEANSRSLSPLVGPLELPGNLRAPLPNT